MKPQGAARPARVDESEEQILGRQSSVGSSENMKEGRRRARMEGYEGLEEQYEEGMEVGSLFYGLAWAASKLHA